MLHYLKLVVCIMEIGCVKTVLVDYGFRLPSALDNRPLNYEEFEKKINQAIYVSATPGDYEL